MPLQIQEHVIKAQDRINRFFSQKGDDEFVLTLGDIKEKYEIDREEFVGIINPFLEKRNIKSQPSLEEMIKMPQEKVDLLGMAYHITRKTVLTSYDVMLPESETSTTNPFPFVQSIFDTLQASDNQHACRFLDGIRASMAGSHNREKQLIVMLALRDVLPALTADYKAQLAELESSKRKSDYAHQVKKAEEKHRQSLDRFVGYVKISTRGMSTPTLEGFKEYMTSSSGAEKQRITTEYVKKMLDSEAQAARDRGEKVLPEDLYLRNAVKIIGEGYEIFGLQYLSTSRRGEAEVRLHLGIDGNGGFISFRMVKEKAHAATYNWLLSLGRGALPTIPRYSSYHVMTLDAINRLTKHVTRDKN